MSATKELQETGRKARGGATIRGRLPNNFEKKKGVRETKEGGRKIYFNETLVTHVAHRTSKSMFPVARRNTAWSNHKEDRD